LWCEKLKGFPTRFRKKGNIDGKLREIEMARVGAANTLEQHLMKQHQLDAENVHQTNQIITFVFQIFV
jgi:hypothetical protein